MEVVDIDDAERSVEPQYIIDGMHQQATTVFVPDCDTDASVGTYAAAPAGASSGNSHGSWPDDIL